MGVVRLLSWVSSMLAPSRRACVEADPAVAPAATIEPNKTTPKIERQDTGLRELCIMIVLVLPLLLPFPYFLRYQLRDGAARRTGAFLTAHLSARPASRAQSWRWGRRAAAM